MASADPPNPEAELDDGQSLRPYQSECHPLSAKGGSAALETRSGAFAPPAVMTSLGGGKNYKK